MSNVNMTNAQIEKIHDEIEKLIAEKAKMNKQTFWYPIFIATGLIGSVATITTIIIKLFEFSPSGLVIL